MTGFTGLSSADYHADTHADQPSLSASIARILIEQSPAHAKAAHPRLTETPVTKEGGALDLGSAVHSILVGGDNRIVVVDAPDWRTKAAQAERDAARDAGMVPVLTKDYDRVLEMADAVRAQLDTFDVTPIPFTAGKAEQSIAWVEDGVNCRGRIDWLHDDYLTIDDLKTTARSANPETFSRTILNSGYDIQAAFYLRGLRAITGQNRTVFRFIVAETTPPYAVSVLALAPDALALADAKVDYAIRTWKTCLQTGEWPAYPRQVCYVNAPGWAEAQWLDREARDGEE